jgi:cold-inducible RNA-binding protein
VNNIFASNFALDISEKTVRGLFVQFGGIERIKIMTDRKTAQPTGVVFVEMTNDAEAERAIAGMNGRDVSGRTLTVNAARPQLHRNSRGGGSRLKGDHSNTRS